MLKILWSFFVDTVLAAKLNYTVSQKTGPFFI